MAELTSKDQRLLRDKLGTLDPLRDTAYARLSDLGEGFQVRRGQRLRFLAIDEPSFLDNLFDDVQENAQERAEVVVQSLSASGIVSTLDRVKGVDLGDGRQGFLIEVEIVGFFDPLTLETEEAAALALVLPLITLATVAVAGTAAVLVTLSLERSVVEIKEGTGFLIPLAAIAIAAAFIVWKVRT